MDLVESGKGLEEEEGSSASSEGACCREFSIDKQIGPSNSHVNWEEDLSL